MKIRRVVTGKTGPGKSIFVHDEAVNPAALASGYEFHRMWGSDQPPALPADGSAPSQPRYFPSTAGYRFGFFTLPPYTERAPEPPPDPDKVLAELEAKVPGMAEALEPGGRGMHTTDTVDFDVVISGEVWLELDDGAEVHLKAGDCVVQNGTRHAWHNRSAQPCVIAVCLLGAKRAR
ncbi:MAG: cupin domain-containing protein [Acidobacteriia bacterium]|nr:cupin domain-containing protein [Terriglobia bacterium]